MASHNVIALELAHPARPVGGGCYVAGVITEMRTYRLKPGTRDEFVRVMREESLPLLEAAGIAVAGCGASLVDEDGEDAYLIRTFDSLAQRDAQDEAFYTSEAWRSGPREAIVSRIESMHTIVLDSTEAALWSGRTDPGSVVPAQD